MLDATGVALQWDVQLIGQPALDACLENHAVDDDVDAVVLAAVEFDVFVERAVAAYKAGPTAYVEGVLSSDTFSDLIDRYERLYSRGAYVAAPEAKRLTALVRGPKRSRVGARRSSENPRGINPSGKRPPTQSGGERRAARQQQLPL